MKVNSLCLSRFEVKLLKKKSLRSTVIFKMETWKEHYITVSVAVTESVFFFSFLLFKIYVDGKVIVSVASCHEADILLSASSVKNKGDSIFFFSN